MDEARKTNIGDDFLCVHRVVTRALNVMVEHSQSFFKDGYPGESQYEGFVNYIGSFSAFLHTHHLYEKLIFFPYLRDKIRDAPYDLLSAQHKKIVPLVDEISLVKDELAARRDDSEGLTHLEQAVTRLRTLWQPHIRIEEAYFSPDRIGPLMDEQEISRLRAVNAEHNQKHAVPDYLVIPFFLYNLSADDRAAMMLNMPAVVTQQLVPVTWKEKWASMQPFLLE